MKMNKKLIAIVIGIIVIIGATTGAYYLVQQNNNKDTQNQQTTAQASKATWASNVLTVKGEDGVTALDLIKQNATIVTSGTGANAFVTSINGVGVTGNQFWGFNVNGEMAQVGVGSYVTKSSDTITLEISTF